MTEEFEEPMQFRDGYPDTNVVSSEECVEFVFMKVQVSLLQDQKAALQTQLAQSEAKLKIAISALEAIQCHGHGEACCDGHMAVKREALSQIRDVRC